MPSLVLIASSQVYVAGRRSPSGAKRERTHDCQAALRRRQRDVERAARPSRKSSESPCARSGRGSVAGAADVTSGVSGARTSEGTRSEGNARERDRKRARLGGNRAWAVGESVRARCVACDARLRSARVSSAATRRSRVSAVPRSLSLEPLTRRQTDGKNAWPRLARVRRLATSTGFAATHAEAEPATEGAGMLISNLGTPRGPVHALHSPTCTPDRSSTARRDHRACPKRTLASAQGRTTVRSSVPVPFGSHRSIIVAIGLRFNEPADYLTSSIVPAALAVR